MHGGGGKGEKKWDNSNSIINKICFKKESVIFCGSQGLPLPTLKSLCHPPHRQVMGDLSDSDCSAPSPTPTVYLQYPTASTRSQHPQRVPLSPSPALHVPGGSSIPPPSSASGSTFQPIPSLDTGLHPLMPCKTPSMLCPAPSQWYSPPPGRPHMV